MNGYIHQEEQVISEFTLSLLEDTGFYEATYYTGGFRTGRQHGGKTMVLFTNNRENLSFYTKRGYELFHEYEITHNGQTMGNWSLKKSL